MCHLSFTTEDLWSHLRDGHQTSHQLSDACSPCPPLSLSFSPF